MNCLNNKIMITGESVFEKDRDLEKSTSVADRIAMFKRKSVQIQHLIKEESPLPSPIVRQANITSSSISNNTPSPLLVDGGVSVSQRISIFRKELEAPNSSSNKNSSSTQPKTIILENATSSFSISERISKLREEQLSNSQISNPNRIVAVVDGSSVSDRVSMLMKQAEKSSNTANRLFQSTSRRVSVTADDSSSQGGEGGIVATSPFLTKPNLIIQMPGSMEKESKNKLQLLLDRLATKDATFTALEFNNSTLLAAEEDNFETLASLLRDNSIITDIQLCNVLMKDRHCLVLVEALKTCRHLAVLNIETNMLTGIGIAAVAAMAERHPTLRELRMDNQKMSVGIEAERAIANCLSQNTNIIRLSYTFREVFVSTYVNKYLQRNLDLVRKLRTGKMSATTSPVPSSTTTTTTPYPYPPTPMESDAAFLSPEMRDKKGSQPASASSSVLSVAQRVSQFSRQNSSDRGATGSKSASNLPPPIPKRRLRHEWMASSNSSNKDGSDSGSGSGSGTSPSPLSPANALLDMTDGLPQSC